VNLIWLQGNIKYQTVENIRVNIRINEEVVPFLKIIRRSESARDYN